MKILWIGLVIWNLAVFALYGIDKWKAIHGKWRVKESTLLLAAFMMGAAGALFSMYFFRHKTQKLTFKILVPLALLFNTTVLFLVYGNVF